MRRVNLLLLGSAWLAAGCSVVQDDYYDPYPTHYEFGQHYSLSVYQLPFAYYQRCYGFYRSCLFYRPPYVPVPGAPPDEDRVIPITHPPIMVNDNDPVYWAGFDGRGPGGNVALERRAIANDLQEPRPAVRKSQRRSEPARLRPTSRPVAPRSAPRSTSRAVRSPVSRPRTPSSQAEP